MMSDMTIGGIPLRYLVGGVLLTVLSVFAQWALWRWIRATCPAWSQRHRRALFGFQAFTCVLPFFRPIRVTAIATPLSIVISMAILWHIVVASAMIAARAATFLAHFWIRRCESDGSVASTDGPSIAGSLGSVPRADSEPPRNTSTETVTYEIAGNASVETESVTYETAGNASTETESVTYETAGNASVETESAEYKTTGDVIAGREPGGLPVDLEGRTMLSRRMLFERVAGTAAIGASAALFGWGMVCGRRDWTVCDVPVRLARLPRVLDGFTIVQISDIHVGGFMQDADLAQVVSRIESLAPDLVVITGDIIDYDPRFIPLAARHLGKLRAREGVVCVLGNHDHYTNPDLVEEGMRRAGLEVLDNQGKVLMPKDGGGIALLGVDDLVGVRMGLGRGPNLARAKSMIPSDRATILLAHQPQYIDKIDHRGIDLQLSGHMHGGQINPGMGLLTLLAPYLAGRYDVDGTVLYVNRGCGVVGPPVRLGSAPEITRLVLTA